ncbi:putative 30S ribosomal subunit protein [Rosellinia necatrix]|uniref:Putative 30S ribosomal subunit protein n=1 Tax=Rosellinia necatrix TaxID=77044 RepID=A0A1W2TDC6_ROSNE|nr:putative 30S ribosomal subunit protein [Rosellinia necatrix]
MKPRRYHGLKRPKLRQSWNKYNLYNLAKAREPRIGNGNRTFFQQKWIAKGLLRTYHGEHIVERKWERMFNRRLLSVVDMDTRYMAKHDGSELAAGRGSGREQPPRWNKLLPGNHVSTPYMQMTFAPMERRLDIAVFRAMFASSARQARQFCVHGAVKVNGKVMPYPAYRLNPGDMFQVDPERVLYATGLPKSPPKNSKRPSPRPQNEATEDDAEGEAEAAAEAESGADAVKPEQDPDTTDAPEPIPADMKPTRKQILNLTVQARAILGEEQLSVAQKKGLRNFIKSAKTLMSRAGRSSASPSEIAGELSTLLGELDIGAGRDGKESSGAASSAAASSDPMMSLSDAELRMLEARMEEHIREEKENPHNSSKPYATPWRPRNYMAPFAFIPQYLEVNQNICSAVYLRHPVARAGAAEVPTPYPIGVNQLAFNWYLRRR